MPGAGEPEVQLTALVEGTSQGLPDLGGVGAVTVLPDGRIVVLDPVTPGVLVTDSTLSGGYFYGTKGDGPGEFREPVSVGALSDGRIAVLDRGLGRITLFTSAGDGRHLEPAVSLRLGVPAEAMCVLPGDTLLIYGYHEGSRLHLFDVNGEHLRSLAPADTTLSPMALSLVTQGSVACDPGEGVAVLTSRFLPKVEAVDFRSGHVEWSDSLAPFHAVGVLDRGSSVTISSGPAGTSIITSQFPFGDYWIFQAAIEKPPHERAVDTLTTYIYQRRTGTWLPARHDAPLMFPVRGQQVLTWQVSARKMTAGIGLARLSVGDHRVLRDPFAP